MSLVDKIYSRSPVWMQNLGIQIYGLYWSWLRFGGKYQTLVNEYKEREVFSGSQWDTYQKQALQQVLNLALTNVPYYQKRYQERDKNAARKGDLTKLPLLEKDPLRQNPTEFLCQNKNVWPKIVFHTSGTTGTPIQSYWTPHEVREAMAVREARSCLWAGISYKMPRATFSGRMVEPDPNSNGPYYRFNATEKQVYLSAFHLSPTTAKQYVESLKNHKVAWLTGYAVSYYLLAKYILDQQLEVPPLQAVITTSEKLTAEMREVMEKAYRCRVYEEYSTVENIVFASECEQGKLHVSPDVSILEVLKEDGTPCEIGEVGEAVVTSLMHHYQIIIRFKTGDLIRLSNEKCACGREMQVIEEVVGRLEDIVTGPDGRQMVRFHGLFVDQPHVVEGQVIQETKETFCLNIVPTEGFGAEDKQDLVSRMRQRLGHDIQVEIKMMEQIPRDKSGKYRAVINRSKEMKSE